MISPLYLFYFPRFRPRFGDDRRKVIFSPMYFQTFRFDSGHRRLYLFCNGYLKWKQAMFNKLEDAKQFAGNCAKELVCIKDPVMIKNKPTYIVCL